MTPRTPPPELVLIGNLPPPVTGLTVITEAFAAAAAHRLRVSRFSISPGQARGALRHIVRGLRVARAASGMIVAFRRGARQLYLTCNGGWGRLYILALIALARLLGMRISLHHHTSTYIARPDALMRALLNVGGRRLGHVFLDETMRTGFVAAYGFGADAPILPNAVFLQPPDSEWQSLQRGHVAGRDIRAGLLANLDRGKGLYELIELARELERRSLPARIVLAGPVHKAADRAALHEAMEAMPDRLTWRGPVYGAAREAFYTELDLLVLPSSLDEAQPAVIYEAAFAGVPSIAWARGGIAEQIGEPDQVLAPGEVFPAWAAERIAAFAKAPETLEVAGERAHRRACDAAERGRAALTNLLDG